jgi:hypothetical protein
MGSAVDVGVVHVREAISLAKAFTVTAMSAFIIAAVALSVVPQLYSLPSMRVVTVTGLGVMRHVAVSVAGVNLLLLMLDVYFM